MNKAKKIRAGKYMYGKCVIEKYSIEKCWFASNKPKGILIKSESFKAAKSAVDNIPAQLRLVRRAAHSGRCTGKQG